MNLLKWVSAATIPVTLSITAACGSAPSNLGTDTPTQSKTAQVALGERISPAKLTSFVLRRAAVSNAPRASSNSLYDFSTTDEARQAIAERKRLRADAQAAGWPSTPPDGHRRVVFVDTDHGVETEQDIATAETGRVWAEAQAVHLNEASRADEIERAPGLTLLETGTKPAAFSYGVDWRIAFPLATYPANHRVLGRMGAINGGGCTGTLVGRRLVLTAAHCFLPPNLVITPQTYTPRADAGVAPYGTATSIGYWYDYDYTNNNCHITRTAATREQCMRSDWAVLLLPDNAWPSGTPGWMGYWVPGTTAETSAVSGHYGYPVCGGYESPAGCVAGRAYGDNFLCKLSAFRTNDWEGDPMSFSHGCDMSAGHSGGAVWSDYPGAGGPYVLGVNTDEYCGGSTCTDPFPNGGKLMTRWLAGNLSSWRVTYP